MQVQSLRELIKTYEWKLDLLEVELVAYQKNNRPFQMLEDVSSIKYDQIYKNNSYIYALGLKRIFEYSD